MLLGFPTSIALARVAMVGCGFHEPDAKYSGMAPFALVASIISRSGSPICRAQNAATAFPRFPVGIMKPGSAPLSRKCQRLAAA